MSGKTSVLAWLGTGLILMLSPACQKPVLRSDKSEEPGKEVEKDPFGDKELKAVETPAVSAEPATPLAVVPELAPQERALEISRKQKMLEAQLAGIRNMEADLARQAGPLNQLRQQLQSVRARQSAQRSGGIRVERVGGKSLYVDRRKEARELESQIRKQEQLVAPFQRSLQLARKDYEELRQSLERLRMK